MRLQANDLALVLLISVACGPGGNGEIPPTITQETGPALAVNSPSSLEGTEASTPTGWTMPEPDQGYNVRQGRVLFGHYCATCHGKAGHGDGFNAYSLDPKPRDLADTTFQARQSDDDLAAVIRVGGSVSGFSAAMPPWGRTLNERDIRNIVRYIRALPQLPE